METESSADSGNLTAGCLHNASPEVVVDHLERGQFFWLDLEGPTDERLQELATNIGLHPLTVDDRQGEVNKQLTMIATIFLPLAFLTGFFGQNFAFLTNHVLNTPLAFAVLGIGLLFAAIFGFIMYFHRKRWM